MTRAITISNGGTGMNSRVFTLISILALLILIMSLGTSFASTDPKGRGKLYELMIKNMVEYQKVIVAMSQGKWDAAGKEIEKQRAFSTELLELYPRKTIEDIRTYRTLARTIEKHVDGFQKHLDQKLKSRAQQELSSLFSLCIQCHNDFRD